MELSRARFGPGGALGRPGIDFEAFWKSPGPDLELTAIGPRGIDFEAFWRSPGPDFELMGHLGIQGSILRHFVNLQGQIWDDGALGPPGVDFDAFWKSLWLDLEVMGHLGLGVDCGASCASVGPNGHLSL